MSVDKYEEVQYYRGVLMTHRDAVRESMKRLSGEVRRDERKKLPCKKMMSVIRAANEAAEKWEEERMTEYYMLKVEVNTLKDLYKYTHARYEEYFEAYHKIQEAYLKLQTAYSELSQKLENKDI
jgi:hypothetical protein